jgi:predicted metal-dependent hydrolase
MTGDDSGASEITVRRLRFDFPDDMDVVFIKGEPEESFITIGISLILPYVEPYLIRTMRAARPLVEDAGLTAALDKFNAQEGHHYAQHARFNSVFRKRGFDGLEKLEQEVAADYDRFTKTKSLRFNLAYAEGFEAFTTAFTLANIERDSAAAELEKWHPAARDLFLWHALEELEHRTVAFDVYQHVCGSFFLRFAVAAFAQRHLMRFMSRAAQCLLGAHPKILEELGGKAGHRARMRRINRHFAREILPRTLRTYSPAYTPHTIAMPRMMESFREEISAGSSDDGDRWAARSRSN